jgi:hypothetical protein
LTQILKQIYHFNKNFPKQAMQPQIVRADQKKVKIKAKREETTLSKVLEYVAISTSATCEGGE